MRGPASQQVQRMRQHRKNSPQRRPRTCGTSRQVHDQGSPSRPAHRPTQRRQRSMQQAIGPHPLRQPLNQPVAHQSCRFRCHIPSSQPSPARRHNKLCLRRTLAKRASDQLQLIRQRLRLDGFDTRLLQQLHNRRAGEIHLPPIETAVADRQYNRVRIGRKSLYHSRSLRVAPSTFLTN